MERDGPDDRAEAQRLRDSAEKRSVELSLGPSLATIASVIAEGGAEAVRSQAAVSLAVESPERDGVFLREHDYWTIGYGGRMFRLKHQRGFDYLAQLLGAPGAAIHALELTGNHAALEADTAPVLDEDATLAYRARIERLQSELEEAKARGDVRGEKLEEELEFLSRELSQAVGLGGRDRAMASTAERARSSVTRALRRATAAIAAADADLGSHLDTTLKTGTQCGYVPDAGSAISWRV